MPPDLSSEPAPDPLTSALCFTLFTGFLVSSESSTNSRCCALKSSLIRPLPTFQTFFTFTPLLGSFILMQTLECWEYHPSARSPVVSTLSLTYKRYILTSIYSKLEKYQDKPVCFWALQVFLKNFYAVIDDYEEGIWWWRPLSCFTCSVGQVDMAKTIKDAFLKWKKLAVCS